MNKNLIGMNKSNSHGKDSDSCFLVNGEVLIGQDTGTDN
jgi:hypothetical protein